MGGVLRVGIVARLRVSHIINIRNNRVRWKSFPIPHRGGIMWSREQLSIVCHNNLSISFLQDRTG